MCPYVEKKLKIQKKNTKSILAILILHIKLVIPKLGLNKEKLLEKEVPQHTHMPNICQIYVKLISLIILNSKYTQ